MVTERVDVLDEGRAPGEVGPEAPAEHLLGKGEVEEQGSILKFLLDGVSDLEAELGLHQAMHGNRVGGGVLLNET
jgi:hypothetical protein